MKLTTLFCTILLSSLLVVPAITRGQSKYTILDLGTLGGIYSGATSVNDAGEVTGYFGDVSPAAQNAFLSSGGQTKDLGALPGDTYSYGAGINASGQVVGLSGNDLGGYGHAFLYSNGQMTNIGSLGEGIASAYGINDSGQIVGQSLTPTGNHAFLYTNGQMQDLETLIPNTSSLAYEINNNGQIVGFADSLSGPEHAFLYNNGKMQDIGTLNGPFNFASRAVSINNSGQVVGVSYSLNYSVEHAFLYSNGKMNDLGTLGGGRAIANNIDTAGNVVGIAQTKQGYDAAFLYSAGKMLDLNTVLPARSGWSLISAEDINDNGWIVGYGYLNADTHAFLLKPANVPGPSSLLIVYIGAITFGMGRGRRKSQRSTERFV